MSEQASNPASSDEGAVSLTDWLNAEGAPASVRDTILAMAQAALGIAEAVRIAPLRGHTGEAESVNVQGEDQKVLDVMSNHVVINALEHAPAVRAMVSEENEEVIPNTGIGHNAHLAVCFDPLDGSSNIETNGVIGTIFSVLDIGAGDSKVSADEVLSATGKQLAAGYFLYGPATQLVISVGGDVAEFTLHLGAKRFLQSKAKITIPESAKEFSINMSHAPFWHTPVKTYIDECMAGKDGPRGKKYNMRWAGSMVADVHRVFARGGIFIYPAMTSKGNENGKLRLLYEAVPMAMLVEKAGGEAIASAQFMRDVKAEKLHQRVPVALGSKEEVLYLLAKERG